MSETISIFILKSQVGSMTQAETFLRNRKWIVGSSTNLRDALAYIIQKQPKYVMISADHPNRKVRVLPKMLVQAFPVRVIGFAEKGTGNSAKSLTEMALEYNLYPPVSGPAIERMVLKIRKDEELRAQQEELAAKNPRPDGSAPGQDTITFKGESMTAGDMKSSFEQARVALSQMINSSDSGEDTPAIISGTRPDSGNAFAQGSSGTPESSGFWGQNQSSDPNSSGSAFTGSTPSSGAQFMMNQGANPSQFAGNVATSFDPRLSGNVATSLDPHLAGNVATNYDPQLNGNVARGTPSEDAARRSPFPQNQEGNGASGADYFNPNDKAGGGGSFQDGSSDWNAHSTSSSENQNSSESDENSSARKRGPQVPIMESDYVPRPGQKEYRMTRAEERQGKANDSIIVRGTEKALEESVNLKSREKAQRVENSSHVACITIESPRFSGYLVCAMGANRKIDKTFFATIQNRLFSFLKANGEQIKDADVMNMKLQEVDFTDWALEQAEFLKKSVHDGNEIAMAFFPSTDLDIQLDDSASDKMVKMSIQDLKENVALEFDLYIFMPENNKYLLYTPKGKPFYGSQKGRLHEKGITHMHLRRDASHNVKKYKAQNFLNEKISAYKAGLKKEA